MNEFNLGDTSITSNYRILNTHDEFVDRMNSDYFNCINHEDYFYNLEMATLEKVIKLFQNAKYVTFLYTTDNSSSDHSCSRLENHDHDIFYAKLVTFDSMGTAYY